MIRKKTLPGQQEFWVVREKIQSGKGGRFYDRLADDLDKEGFGDHVRGLCEPFYHEGSGGRPPIDPEVYFKMLIVGFFEKIGSERGIASRCEDSISIRRFLRYDITEATPEHSSLSVIRQRLPEEIYEEVFAFSLRPLRKAGLLPGKAMGMDSSLTEANASLEKLTRREDGKSYREYVGELAAQAESIDPEDRAAVAAFDRRRKGKKVSNQEWYSPNDPDAKIGPRKDGAWDMIHKVENVVDLDSGAILSVEVQDATEADSTGMAAHFETAAAMVEYTDSKLEVQAQNKGDDPDNDDNDNDNDNKGGETQEQPMAVADKGYHKNEELARLVDSGLKPVVAEPAGRKASEKDPRHAEAFELNQANRHSEEGRERMRQRCEKTERSFRHLLDYGAVRRTTLSVHKKIRKRTLISAFGFNLSIHSWHVHGVGTVKQSAAGNRNPNQAAMAGIWLETLLGRPAQRLKASLGNRRKILRKFSRVRQIRIGWHSPAHKPLFLPKMPGFSTVS